ncbi:hypothetical protein E8E12_009365 [Didymella heteroderae]|uniref:Uncharacterized protein n=1 Tax=Didymella heteroderae TaxID=1769908 RepID=A0A9P5C3P1_9PLEO|nr:hypothetical protein E8E12_009365 [Didymella heteroderae]
MSWISPDSSDLEPSSPQLPTSIFQPAPQTTIADQVPSNGLQTLRRADKQLRGERKYASARWDEDDDLDPQSTVRRKPKPSDCQTRSPGDEADVFEVQRQPVLDSRAQQLDEDGLPNDIEQSALPLANRGENIKTQPLISPLQSPNRDPRSLFGSPSQETHLPWVRKVSNGQFSMTVSPNLLPRDAPPPKSIWDAEEEEFDRWPTAVEARAELDAVRLNATTKRSTFVKPEKAELSVAEQIAEAVETPIGETIRTEGERRQAILELEDMDCGNPWGRDLHDKIMTALREECALLPKTAPPRHMHVLDAKTYTSSIDPVTKAARPRLCDAVATVLAYTNEECLRDFLNPEIEVFEWRRNNNCVLIRREGKQVMVGNYYNFGTMYQWGFLVRSTIDSDGAWSETWASVSQGTTPVGQEGVLYDHFEADGTDWDVQPDDEEFALYVGRDLADFLLRWEVWNYHKWWRYQIEWDTDGKR